ncbi:PA14 domain-containing protein, partial [Bacillus yapensis]|uniref:PA14 domain-containing protein n=1 Tax=Bacillus yapensis TaxID=2492960 RepID=UPI001FE3A2D9
MIGLLSSGVASANESYPVFTPTHGSNVHYNWGAGSPEKGIPNDNFGAIFNQSGFYSKGDYFIQTFADDKVKVSINGNKIIDRWNENYWGTKARAIWLNDKEGQHTIETEYYEKVGDAAIFSDIVPFDSWLAYYYENNNLAGYPTAAKVISPDGTQKNLQEDFGANGPVPGYKKDNFSARYTTATRIPAGEYILRTKADDGVRVYLDGKLVLDRWTNSPLREDATKIQIGDRSGVNAVEKDIHWIDVEYYDAAELGKIDFSILPFEGEVENSWVGEYYPNISLSGNPFIVGGENSTTKFSNLNLDWKSGSPHSSIPSDQFSARFTKKENLEAGLYIFEVNSDDGIRVWVDDELVIDSWVGSNGLPKSGKVSLEGGQHTIKVEYFEGIGDAHIKLNYRKIPSITKADQDVHYNWGYGSPVGFPNDYFMGVFDQSRHFARGDYFV